VPAAYAATFSNEYAKVTKIGNGYTLDAQVAYPLTERVKEAIDNSVPIVFSQQFKLIKKTPLLGKYWQWETTLWSTEIRYEIRYHALSQQYTVHNIGTHHQSSFPTLAEALQTLGQIRALTLPPEHLEDTDNISLIMHSELDLYALPTPMRPGALISSKWQLASPWVSAQWD
jgi:hypothetical protein